MTIDTDNASNITKAFDLSLPGYVTEKEANKDDDSDVEDDNTGSSEESSSQEDSLTECLPTHSRCYAHSLQLVVKDGLKDASQQLRNVISKASNIVCHVRKFIHATDIFEEEKHLHAANATACSWNSQLKMIRSVLEAQMKISTYWVFSISQPMRRSYFMSYVSFLLHLRRLLIWCSKTTTYQLV